jgi:hypothetical protein
VRSESTSAPHDVYHLFFFLPFFSCLFTYLSFIFVPPFEAVFFVSDWLRHPSGQIKSKGISPRDEKKKPRRQKKQKRKKTGEEQKRLDEREGKQESHEGELGGHKRGKESQARCAGGGQMRDKRIGETRKKQRWDETTNSRWPCLASSASFLSFFFCPSFSVLLFSRHLRPLDLFLFRALLPQGTTSQSLPPQGQGCMAPFSCQQMGGIYDVLSPFFF